MVNQLKTFKLIFMLACCLLVIKPFLGFSILNGHVTSNNSNSILAKVFAKRKPEELEDARKQKATIASLLSNPPVREVISIFALLAILLPFFNRLKTFSQQQIDQLTLLISSPQPAYLLSGKLTI